MGKGGPIQLNAGQESLVTQWAADDRLWTTGETVQFNLRVFARAILAAASGTESAPLLSNALKELEWWKTHSIVILDQVGEPRCHLKGTSLCSHIEAQNRQLKDKLAALKSKLSSLTQAGAPEIPWSEWAQKHMTALRNAIFATVPEEEKNANIGDDALVKWPGILAERLKAAQSQKGGGE
jgi:hypothetical protein